jgi:organic hydroperoxide reductase OsmC/OhrA
MSQKFGVTTNWDPKGKNFTYNEYSREYIISAASKPELIGTAAVEYKGSPEHYNPEDMLIASLSGCHMLSYLALAANAKITVLSYVDNADGSLQKDGMSAKFAEVTLRPKVLISEDSDPEKALALHEKAHHICFVAKSVNFSVHVAPEIIK